MSAPSQHFPALAAGTTGSERPTRLRTKTGNRAAAARSGRARYWLIGALVAAALLPHNFQNFGLAAAPEALPSGGAAPTRAGAPAAMGRLFYTPDRRLALDRQRATNRPAERKVESRQLSFDGLVQRAGGKQTVWVNGRPLTERDAEILKVTPDPKQPGRARISIPNEAGHDLTVGSSVNRETGEVRSPLGAGRVTRTGPN